MELAIVLLAVISAGSWVTNAFAVAQLKALKYQVNQLENLSRARLGTVGRQVVSVKNPPVDSRARTTRRDTPDLPSTGRMSIAVHREKSNHGNSPDN